MKRLTFLVLMLLLTASLVVVHAQTPPSYAGQGSVNVAPASPKLTAVDPMGYGLFSDVLPPRPFLYTVDKDGITITRFNDNKVVGYWAWPKDVIYTVLPDGGFTGLTPPAVWEPVAMTVTYPTEAEIANRVKEIPDLTPPWTFVYVVMARSGYEWRSGGGFRDTIVPSTNPETESSLLIQIDVSDPSFSARNDGVAPVYPHVAAALLGHGANQPVYDRSTGNVYVSNMPSNSLPASLSSFVSVVRRIPPTVTAEEREVPGVAIPVIRCGPQHPESGIPVGRPQAYACYDPSGVHPIDDNEHVGAFGNFDWEFRNLPDWLKVGYEIPCAAGVPAGVHCSKDGILYGTPPATGDWTAEARVHNLDDEYGIFSYWAPVRFLVTPTAEYLPVKVEFAAGVPVAYQLEGTGSCSLTGAPTWVDVVQVPNGCVVMGKAPLDGEHYNFSMPGFTVAGYPTLSLVFSGNVFGEYGFVPLPTGVGLSGLAWHQVSKIADPSTETPALSLEYIGVEPSTGQLYRILAPPGMPQPPNERPPETALTLDVVSTEGSPLSTALTAARPEIAGHLVRFGQVAVEADRDIFVAVETDSTIPDGALMKVSGGTPGVISLTGMQASFMDIDSDLRTAIIGVEPGQVDHGALFVSGAAGNVAVVDTTAGTVSQTIPLAGPLGSISVDFPTRYAYVAAESGSVAIFGPEGSSRPPMKPRIWSSEELGFNLGFASIAPEPFRMMATGDGVPTLSLLGELPTGLTFTDMGDGTATITGIPTVGGDFAFTLLATGSSGSYAQSFGITVYTPATLTSTDNATFVAGSASSFTVTVDPDTAIIYTWDEALMPKGVLLVDNENGTASLVGTPEAEGIYTFRLGAETSYPTDAEQLFTLNVLPATPAGVLPVITSPSTVTWEVIGAPFSPDMFTITSIGSPTPTLSVIGTLPPGVSFIDNGDSTGILGGGCVFVWPTQPPSCLGTLPDSAAGTWTFTIRATNSAGSTDQTFTLVVEPCTSIMGASPSTLSFAYTFDGTLPPSQTVHLTTLGDTLTYALVTTAPWLSATPISGTMPSDITVSVDISGLAAGSYTGTVIVGSAGTDGPFATIAVSLNVSAVPSMGITPTALAFRAKVIDTSNPPPQTLSLNSGGVPMSYTVTTGGATWLSATPTSGNTPAGITVAVDASQLALGTHTTTVTVSSNGTVNTIPITVMKTWSGATLFNPVIDFMADVGGEGLTINRETHQLFINAAMEAAPGGGETGEGGTAPEAPTPIVPTTVLHVDPINKMVVAALGVHSEGEYVAANSTTGLVYHASQGTGEIAVMDGSTDKVLGFISLMVDKVAYLPYQIAIDEAQNFIYVGGHAPAIVDPPHAAPFPCKAIHELPDDEYDCWNPGRVFVIDGKTNKVVSSFIAGDDPEGVVFAAANNKVYASNEDDGSVTVAQGAIRNTDGSITAPQVRSTIIRGQAVGGSWHPTCDANNFCGERGQAALWPQRSACNGIDDEAEEADKMVVDPAGNVYIIDDRYRVGKIKGDLTCSNGCGAVEAVLDIEGYDCEAEVPDGSNTVFRNTANNIAFSAPDAADPTTWRLFVISEQNTISVIDPIAMTLSETITIPDAIELDAPAADAKLNRLYISDEASSTLWILQGPCADGKTDPCVQPKEPADFAFQASPNSQIVNAGQSAQYSIDVNGSPTFSGTVALTCTAGLPKGASCSFGSSNVTPGPNGLTTTMLTISTTPHQIASMSAPSRPRSGGMFFAAILPMAGVLLGGFSTVRRRKLTRGAVLFIFVALLLLVTMLGCSGGRSTPPPPVDPGTPAGTYSVTVSATSGTISHSGTVTIAVN